MKDAVLLRVSDITGDERQIEQFTPVLTGTARRCQAPVFLVDMFAVAAAAAQLEPVFGAALLARGQRPAWHIAARSAAPFLPEPSLAESGPVTKEAVVGHPLRCC